MAFPTASAPPVAVVAGELRWGHVRPGLTRWDVGEWEGRKEGGEETEVGGMKGGSGSGGWMDTAECRCRQDRRTNMKALG